MPANPVSVFICHAPEDHELCEQLEKHLKPLQREGKLVRTWSARAIGAGEQWRGELDRRIDEADVILLLVSPDLLASDYLYEGEVRRAFEQHAAGKSVFAIVLRPVEWQVKGSLLEGVRRLPTSGRALTLAPDLDAAFVEVLQELRDALDEDARPRVGRISNRPSVAHPLVAPSR